MRLTLENGFDWTKPSTLARAKKLFDLHLPRMVWGSPECGPFSAVQNLNQGTQEQIDDLQQKRRHSADMIMNVLEFLQYARDK